MTTAQIIIYSIIGILIIISYFIVALTKKENKRLHFVIIVWVILSGLLFAISITSTAQMNKYEKESKGKCPEYKRIENVYQLIN